MPERHPPPTRRDLLVIAALGGAAAAAPTALHAEASNDISPFRVSFPDDALADLQRRVLATRWPDRELVGDASQGVQLSTMKALARYWAADHDWRRCEAKLNALPQFVTEIDGVQIHFIHVRSKQDNALPIII